MPLLLCRVDQRLVHGQVLEGWVPALGVDLIVVSDAELKRDDFQKSIVEALGSGWPEIIVADPTQTRALVEKNPGRNVMVLFRDIAGALENFRLGLAADSLNLGNVHYADGSRRITENVYLGAKDASMLREIIGLGVRVEARAVPSDRPFPVTGPSLGSGS